jgi:uncharacterized membrane protein YcaP (DUF421 family)
VNAIFRALFIYIFLLVVMRVSGRRTPAQLSPFDFVLLLVIGNAAQQGISGYDYSATNAALLIITLVMLDMLVSVAKQRSRVVARLVDGAPLIIVENGAFLRDRMDQVRVTESEVMAAVRRTRGLEHISQVKYAVIEYSGHISIIPMEPARGVEASAEEEAPVPA